MKLGITSLIYHKRGFKHCIRDIADAGYSFVEPNFVIGYFAHFNAIQLIDSPETLDAMSRVLKANGIQCSAVDCHGLCMGSRSEIPYTIEYTSASIKCAVALNCPMIITSYPGGELSWTELVDATGKLAQEARDAGVHFAVEPERGYTVSNSTNLRRLIDDVGGGLVKVNFDPTHFIAEGEDEVRALHSFDEELIHVHLKDYINGQPAPYLGKVGSPADRILMELKRNNFEGVVSVETLADVCQEPERLSREILSAVNKRLTE